MGYLGYYLLAFLAVSNVSLRSDLAPAIEWRFHARSCTACVSQQIDLMRSHAQADDQIVVYSQEPQHDQTQAFVAKLQMTFPEINLEIVSQGTIPGVGWVYRDAFVGERIQYHSDLGKYNAMRSRYLLGAVRESKQP